MNIKKTFSATTLVLSLALALHLHGQSGGTERWPVKVGSDGGATGVNLSPIPISIHDLVRIERPQLPDDDDTRLTEEQKVYVVEGYLVKFKLESGRTGDQDYHLVFTDDSLQFSAGGSKNHPVEHSVVAEVVNPDCIAGRQGDSGATSHFQDQIAATRARFNQHFPAITGGWNDAEGVRVRITAVGFFDRQHGQVGRALNGIELHPILDIMFDPEPSGNVPTRSTTMLIKNPGFEEGDKGWVASEGVISNDSDEPARTGSFKAWLGGYGKPKPKPDQMYQEVTLPADAQALTLAFYLHVSTEEEKTQAFDTLTVSIRRPNGSLVKKLATLSNVDAAHGYRLKTYDLTPFKGQTVRIYFTAVEDNGSLTSFVIDDVRIAVE